MTSSPTRRLDPRQAAILGAFTGVLCGPYGEMVAYIEEIMGRPVFTYEMANVAIVDQIKELARPDFLSIVSEANQ